VEDRQLDCKIYSVHTLQEFLQVLLDMYCIKGRSYTVQEVDNSKLLIESDRKTRDKMSFIEIFSHFECLKEVRISCKILICLLVS
jgi:hypothetical protein